MLKQFLFAVLLHYAGIRTCSHLKKMLEIASYIHCLNKDTLMAFNVIFVSFKRACN